MVNCIRCNEPIVHFSPIPCVCDTCYAVDDLPRHAEASRRHHQEDLNDIVDRAVRRMLEGRDPVLCLTPRHYQ